MIAFGRIEAPAPSLIEVGDRQRAVSLREHEGVACAAVTAGQGIVAACGSATAVQEAGGGVSGDRVGELRTDDVRDIDQRVGVTAPTRRAR